MDTGTALTVLGSAIGGAKVVEKLLGPTADYIGEGIKNWTEKRVHNVSRIFQIAAEKLGTKIDEEGAVSPKVLKGILDEGSFCDDELAAEYFGGVLASSRSGVARDDRGATYIALLGRLSTYQIRMHYCLYHLFKRHWNGQLLELSNKEVQEHAETGLTIESYEKFMNFELGENGAILIPHIISGLVKELLIAEPLGTNIGLKTERADVLHISSSGEITKGNSTTHDFIYIQPTIPGIELFLWAYGMPNTNYKEFFNHNNKFDLDNSVQLPGGLYKSFRAK
jgi:hypothetical protein